MDPQKFIKQLIHPIFDTRRTRDIFHVNPTLPPSRKEPEKVNIAVYDFGSSHLEKKDIEKMEDLVVFRDNSNITWINIDGLKKSVIEDVCKIFGIHNLIVEDILSIGQRPKMDEIDDILYCLLNMLYFNEQRSAVEVEQISIVLGRNFVITFQEDPIRDVFNVLREKLNLHSSRLRNKAADYLCYTLLDMIVDHYFVVMEKLGNKIEVLEEEIIRRSHVKSLAKINNFRKEVIVLRRNVAPVRDLVNGFIKSESDLLEDANTKYYKDVYDHINQANEFAENYRDMLNNLQELYISKVNLKMNEVMKVMAVVTCLLAPATVIGGIFGMNFNVIPFSASHWAFYITVTIMLLIIPVIMMILFKKRGWF